MTIEHTPGPWRAFTKDGKHVQAEDWSIDHDGRGSTTYAPIKAGSHVVAFAVASAKYYPDLPDIAHNARLIAAAPELLEMLEKIHEAEFGFGCWPTSDEIVAMIAKAKGGAV